MSSDDLDDDDDDDDIDDSDESLYGSSSKKDIHPGSENQNHRIPRFLIVLELI